jgi:hypothetical protein
VQDGERGRSTTAIRPGMRALAVGLSAATAALAFASTARAEDVPSPPSSVPIPAAGMSALILTDAPDDTNTTQVPVPTEESPAPEAAVVIQIVEEVQKKAVNDAVSALARQSRALPAAHPVAVHAPVISPRAQSEPSHAIQAARPVQRTARKVRFGWYQVRSVRYHGDRLRHRGPPAHASPSTGPHRFGDRAASFPEGPSNDGQICLPDSSICVGSCSVNQLENALQNGDWILPCILLPSLPDTSNAGQPTTPGSEPTPPEPSASTGPEPQYQCSDAQYHEVCCELALELSPAVPLDCADVISVPVSGTDDGFIPVASAPTTQASTGPAAPAGAGSTDAGRPPALPATAPFTETLWEHLSAPPLRSSGASGVEAPREPVLELAEARPGSAPTAPSKGARAHVSPPRSTPPRDDRSAAPAHDAPSAKAAGTGSLLGWFLVVAGLVMLAALASVSGLEGALAGAMTAVRSHLGSKGLSGRRSRRARRGGIRYRD